MSKQETETPAERSDVGNIYQRLHWVMGKIHYLQKDDEVGFGKSKYTAITHGHVVNKSRELFQQAGMVVITSIDPSAPSETNFFERIKDKDGKEREGTRQYYKGRFVVSFIVATNAETAGELIRHDVAVEMHGEDYNDKGPAKAMSMAQKYGILKTLLIETGDREEERIDQPPPTPTKVNADDMLMKAGKRMNMSLSIIKKEVGKAIEAAGLEAPESISWLNEAQYKAARNHLGAMWKASQEQAASEGKEGQDKETTEETLEERTKRRQKGVNAMLKQRGFDREVFKAGLEILHGVSSTGALGELDETTYRKLLSDPEPMMDAGLGAGSDDDDLPI